MYLLIFSQQGTAKIELDKESTFALNLQTKDFSIISEKSNIAFFSFGGSLDYESSKKQLQDVVDRNCFRPGDFLGREVKAWILSDGDNYLGSITFDGVKKTNGRVLVNFTFLGGNANWIKSLPEYLVDLDLGETLIVVDTTQAVVNAYTGAYDPDEGSIWFSYKIYNSFLWQSGVPGYTIGEYQLMPDVYFKAILDAMASAVGLNMVSQLFASEWFGRWLMPFTGEKGVKHHVVTLDTPPGITLSDFVSTDLWTEVFDPGNLHASDTFLNFTNWDSQDLVNIEFQLDWTVATAQNAVVHIWDIVTFESLDSHPLVVGENNIVLRGVIQAAHQSVIFIEGECTLSAGEIRYITSSKYIINGQYLVNNSPINVGLKTIDFINELTLMCNLIWYHDAKSHKLVVDSKWGGELTTGEVVDGFYKASTFAQNWPGYLDCKNENFEDIAFGYRSVEWRLDEDNNDDYVLDHTTYGHIETIKESGEPQVKQNKIFAPTENVTVPDSYQNNLNAAYTEHAVLPVMGTPSELDAGETLDRYNFKPRILYKMGTTNWSVNHTDTLGNAWIAVAMQRYDVRDNLNLLDVPTTALVGNLGYDDFNGVNGFISTFYKPDVNIWKYGGRKTVSALIPLAIFLNIENLLRYKKLIGFRDTGSGLYLIESAKLILNKQSVTELNLIDIGVQKVNL